MAPDEYIPLGVGRLLMVIGVLLMLYDGQSDRWLYTGNGNNTSPGAGR